MVAAFVDGHIEYTLGYCWLKSFDVLIRSASAAPRDERRRRPLKFIVDKDSETQV